jgi:hypothetical protein
MLLLNIFIVLLVILILHHFYNFVFKKNIVEGLEDKLKQYKETGLEKDPVYLSITNAANITFLKSQVDDLIGLKQIVNDLSVKVEQNSTTISDLGQSLTITSQELVGANKAQMAGKEPIPQATGLE